jgi:ribose 5-phosphate isomerase A
MFNAIIDLSLGAIPDPERLEHTLGMLPGVVEVGIFIGICGIVMMGTDKGVEEITRP